MITTKKISELEQLENLSAASNVIIEENGETKRFSASNIGKVKTVNGAAPDESGNIQIDLDFIPVSEKGAMEGIATLDENGKVPSEQLPDFELPEMDYIPNSEKGASNGVATLNENGKIPVEQLPDDIGGGGGGAPAEHTHDVSDIVGLLSEETYTTLTPFWKHSEDMTPDIEMPQNDGTWSIYFISDNSSPESWIGSTITTMGGETIEITSDNIVMTITGLYNIKHPTSGDDYLLVFTSDFDPSVIGLESITTGTCAIRSSSGWGVASIASPTEVTENVISKELLPEPLRIHASDFKLEWDGSPTETYIAPPELDGMSWYKIAEPYNGTLKGFEMSVVTGGGTSIIVFDSEIVTELESGSSHADVYVFNITQDNETINADMDGTMITLTFTEKGMYGVDLSAAGVESVVIKSPTIYLDEKFIPDTIARKSDLENIDLSTKADLGYDGKLLIGQLPCDYIINNVVDNVTLSELRNDKEYQTKSEVETLINNALSSIGIAEQGAY